ncbi:PREDICTED: uncharacterized protein C8orf58 homolog [Gekko japonicus]|uniref:Uncharacterized protein C8orf58 homolog n=1 Tax=Gekko japonicus TaxID=146911 RepID=A0ABM1K7I5_GEKJA|nr:PREDICTED: uncharacterized protein C8orf58 homolog [Gekko japonicus]
MLKRRRVFSVEPLWNRDGAWKPLESSVVLTSISMYRNLQDPQSPREGSLKLELDGKKSSEMDRWGEAGSPTELVPHKGLNHQLGFIPTSGRLLKSESEDSGVEMASGDHSPSTPVDSEKSFTLDCVDGFQPLAKDSATVVSHDSSPEAEERAEPDPGQDRPYHRNLSVSKKLAQVVQRSQKHRLPGRSSRQLNQRPRSLLDLERLKTYCPQRPASIDDDDDVGASCGGYGSTTSVCNSPAEHHVESVVQDEPSLTMPGQGLRYLEHICQMMEKIAQLQRANQRLQYQHQIMECRLRAQESENDGLSEETPEELRLTRAEPPLGSQAATEMEESPHSPNPYYPHHFRARSASDTHVVLSPVHHSESRPDRSGKTAAYFSSSPSLLDQQDGGSCTLPPGMKLKNEHSHWGKVKVLINRIKRKSVRANEQIPFGEAAPSSRRSRADDVSDKQELQPRRRFLPTLGAKKRQSKHLPMR